MRQSWLEHFGVERNMAEKVEQYELWHKGMLLTQRHTAAQTIPHNSFFVEMYLQFLSHFALFIAILAPFCNASALEKRVKCSVVDTVTVTRSATAYSTSVLFSTSTVYTVLTLTSGVAPPASTVTLPPVTVSLPSSCETTNTISNAASTSTLVSFVTSVETIQLQSTITSFTTQIAQVTQSSLIEIDQSLTSLDVITVFITTTETLGFSTFQTSTYEDQTTVWGWPSRALLNTDIHRSPKQFTLII